MGSPRNRLLLSAASVWELAIKRSLGKLSLPAPTADYVLARMADNGIRALSISREHALAAADLPMHHKDPFDRMLVAQARIEGMKLMTVDRNLAAYSVDLLWAD